MPAGSFWTQPAGQVHITAAKGNTLAYIEIEAGPYLVLPVEKAFDDGQRPVNVDESNIVWLDASSTTWAGQAGARAHGPAVAFLWGHPEKGKLNGTLVKIPAGFTGTIRSRGSTFRAVVIQGRPTHRVPGETDATTLEPGSYFSSTGAAAHQVSSGVGADCIIYVRTDDTFKVVPDQPGK